MGIHDDDLHGARNYDDVKYDDLDYRARHLDDDDRLSNDDVSRAYDNYIDKLYHNLVDDDNGTANNNGCVNYYHYPSDHDGAHHDGCADHEHHHYASCRDNDGAYLLNDAATNNDDRGTDHDDFVDNVVDPPRNYNNTCANDDCTRTDDHDDGTCRYDNNRGGVHVQSNYVLVAESDYDNLARAIDDYRGAGYVYDAARNVIDNAIRNDGTDRNVRGDGDD
jgi:hypothetical protein